LILFLFVLTEFTNVTDTQTDTHTQTPHDDIGRACIASRGKNCNDWRLKRLAKVIGINKT